MRGLKANNILIQHICLSVLIIILTNWLFAQTSNKSTSSSSINTDVLSKYNDINKLKIQIPKLKVIPKAVNIPLIIDMKKGTTKYIKAKGPTFKRRKASTVKTLTLDSIKAIEKLLKVTTDKKQRFELLKRMGELYSEYAEFLIEDELKKFEKAYQQWESNGRKGKEPVLNHNKSVNMLKKSSQVYKKILQEYDDVPNLDLICYELGKIQLRLGDDTGIVYFQKVLKDFPKSKLLPDVYLALGDYYFEKYDMVKAKNYYGKILPYKNFEWYAYALYKLGWTFYNYPITYEEEQKKNYENAIKAFKAVVRLSQINPTAEKIGLKNESIKDLIMVFAEAEKTHEAMLYFKSIDSEESYFMVLERLGWIYTDQGKYDKAKDVYEKLIKEAPLRKNVIEIYIKLINVYYLAESPNMVVTGLRKLINNYFYKLDWQNKYSADKEYIKSMYKDLEFTLRKYATEFHKYAQEAKNKVSFLRASILYNSYLRLFPKSEYYYDMSYYFADALLELEKYELAGYQYMKVVNQNVQGKFFEIALVHAIYAFNLSLEKNEQPKSKNISSTLEDNQQIKMDFFDTPQKLSKTELTFIKALDMYVKYFPKKSDAIIMAYTAAEQLYKRGHYDKAIPRFKSIISVATTSQQAEAAIYLVFSYYIQKQAWDDIIQYSQEILQKKELESKPFYKDINKLLIEVSYKKALALESKKEYNKAAELFVEFSKKFPNEPSSPRALYNAVLNYFKSFEIDKAMSVAINLFNNYPKFEKRKEILILIAETYEKLGEFESAAVFYSKICKFWPKDPQAAQALYNAAIIMQSLKKYEESIKLFVEFESQYNQSSLIKDVIWNLARLYELNNKINEAIKYYNIFYNQYKNQDISMALNAKAKYLLLNFSIASTKINMDKEMSNFRKELVTKYKKYPALDARGIVSKYLFDKTGALFDDFKKQTFDGKLEKLEKFLRSKQKKLENLAYNYQKIINIAYPEYIVASNVMLAKAHQIFADLLLKEAERKYDLSLEGLSNIQNTLKKLSNELLTQAISFYEKAYTISLELEAYSQWSKMAYDELQQRGIANYKIKKHIFPNVYYISYDLSKYDKDIKK